MKAIKSLLLFSILFFALVLPSLAEGTPTEAVQNYWVISRAAATLDEITPLMAKSIVDDINKADAAFKATLLKEIKGEPADSTVVDETVTGNSAVVNLQAGGGKTGTAKLLLEGGAWKLSDVTWKN